MPKQPEQAGEKRPDMKSVAHENDLVRRGADIGAVTSWRVHCIARHDNSPERQRNCSAASSYLLFLRVFSSEPVPASLENALATQLTLGRRHRATRTRVDRNR